MSSSLVTDLVCDQPQLAPASASNTRIQTLLATLQRLSVDITTLFTFTCFRHLPPELRFKIWKLAAQNERRTIYIRHKNRIRQPREHENSLHAYTQDNAPGFLTASRESRAETLSYYIACKERMDSATRTFYINFDLDRFILTGAGVDSYEFGEQNFDLDFMNSIQTLIHPCRSRSVSSMYRFLIESRRWFKLAGLRWVCLSGFPSRWGSPLVSEILADGNETCLVEELERKDNQESCLARFQYIYGLFLGNDDTGVDRREVDMYWAIHGDLDLSPGMEHSLDVEFGPHVGE